MTNCIFCGKDNSISREISGLFDCIVGFVYLLELLLCVLLSLKTLGSIFVRVELDGKLAVCGFDLIYACALLHTEYAIGSCAGVVTPGLAVLTIITLPGILPTSSVSPSVPAPALAVLPIATGALLTLVAEGMTMPAAQKNVEKI